MKQKKNLHGLLLPYSLNGKNNFSMRCVLLKKYFFKSAIMMRLPGTFLIKFLLLLSVNSEAQQYRFRTIPFPNGDSWGLVTSITQDGEGNMWFAGWKGLYKYDGNSFSQVLSSNLTTVYAARNGLIWIGTPGSGLDRYDPGTGTFTHFGNLSKDTTSLPLNYINTILEDHEGNIWIGTGDGLGRFNEKTGSFINYRNNPSDSTSLSDNTVTTLFEDRQGTLWVGTGSTFITSKRGGLNRLNRETGTFTRYTHKDGDPATLTDDRVGAIMEDSHGTFWVGTAGDGLHILDRSTGLIKRLQYDPAKPGNLSRPPLIKNSVPEDHITFIKEDSTGTLWIGTGQGGLGMYSPRTGNVIHYNNKKKDTPLFTDSMFWRCYTSKDGILWMSTWEGSLYQVDPYRKTLPFYSVGSMVTSVYEESPEVLWLGTQNKGLIKKNITTNVEQAFIHEIKNPFGISSDTITYIYKDSEKKLWIGTENGLNRFGADKNNFFIYKHDLKNKDSPGSDSIHVIYEDNMKNFWIGTYGGLDLMDRKTGRFSHFTQNIADSNSIGSNTITCIHEDSKERLWIGTWFGGGLNLMDRKTSKFSHYLGSVNVSSVYQDKNGILWAGTEDGLYSFNERSGNFIPFYTPVSGKKIPNVLCIVEDDKKNLWLRTRNEIIRVDSLRSEIKIFGKDFGVQAYLYPHISGTIGRRGNIIFSDEGGYYSFFPDQLTGNPNPPRLILTELRVLNEVVKPGKNSILKEPLSATTEIRLNHTQNTFSLNFKVFDYSSEGSNHILFMLENYDKRWREPGTERTVNYYNVPPGEYTFRIKVSNSEGRWVEKAIRVAITPPWWSTWWAYTLYSVIFIAGIWSFIYYRSRALRQKNLILEEKINHRTSQLKHSLENLKSTQAQLIQSEKMASLGVLTAGVAHEIQNPLNFVNNFSEVNKELLLEMKDEIDKGNIDQAKIIADNLIGNEEKINQHGKRADAIIKGMLQHSRASTGQKEPTDINELADEYLRLSYHGLRAKDKSFNASIEKDFDERIGKINIIPQDIGRAILNLINNAFYAVTEKKKNLLNPSAGGAKNIDETEYEPTVTLSTKAVRLPLTGESGVLISVKDNGNGIPQKVLDKIYQPFFTTKPTGQGTGLGLSLSYDIIKAHGGEIKVETKEGEYTEFIILMPAT